MPSALRVHVTLLQAAECGVKTRAPHRTCSQVLAMVAIWGPFMEHL